MHAPAFQYRHAPEPHLVRRLRLLNSLPQVRELYGFDRRTIAVTIAVVAAQLLAAGSVARLQLHWALVTAAAWTGGAILSHWAGQAIHETAHNLAARTRLANRALAWVANGSMVFPISETFHRYHLAHHKYLGVDALDTDLPKPLEAKLIGNRPGRKLGWLFFYFFVYVARGLTFAKRPSRGEVAQFVAVVALDLVLWRWLGARAVAYLALSTMFGHSLHPVAAHFIHEHYVFFEGQETNSYYGPLNWVTFNVGYHVEHHDFMNVPGWRLPRLRALAAEHYRHLGSHRSWTCVLWRFITTRRLGVGSRIVRTREDFHSFARDDGSPAAAHILERDPFPAARSSHCQ